MNQMLWEMLEESLQRHPAQTISSQAGALTYGKVSQLVRAHAAQCKPNHKYAILCASELENALAVLCCLAANAVAIPLSLRYGSIHNQKILLHTKPDYIITKVTADTLVIEENAPSAEEGLEETRLLLSTSGSTGAPKTAMLSEGNVFSNLQDIAHYFPLETGDRILIARPIYHCAVLTGEFFISILKGASIHFYEEAYHPLKLLQTISAQRITVLGATPTIWGQVCMLLRRQAKHCTLRIAVVSGEMMRPRIAQAMLEQLPKAQIYHVYGLTEASPRVACLPPADFAALSGSVGKPLRSVSAKIIDAAGSDVTGRADGMLFIKGPNIMQGYYRDAAATSRAVTDGWLKTGDLARMLPNGYLELLGRADDLILRAGMNIYPKEIESALLQDRRIEQAQAYRIEDPAVGQKIGLRVQSALSRQELYGLCQALLPGYQLPDVIEVSASWGMNASGKQKRT